MMLVFSPRSDSFRRILKRPAQSNDLRAKKRGAAIVAWAVILALAILPLLAQDTPPQQDPGQAQDAEGARVKLLKAADQLDMIETGYEAVRVNVDNLKKQVQDLTQGQTRLEQENADLKTQLAALQDEMKHQEEMHAAEQKELLAQVADLISTSLNKSKTHGHPLKPVSPPPAGTTAEEPVTEPSSDTSTINKPHLMDNPPDPTLVGSGDTVAEPSPVPVVTQAPSPHPIVEHGYNHTVTEGETLSQIAREYRAQGVKVTVAEICKANNMTAQVVLKPGQKIFIPKL